MLISTSFCLAFKCNIYYKSKNHIQLPEAVLSSLYLDALFFVNNVDDR